MSVPHEPGWESLAGLVVFAAGMGSFDCARRPLRGRYASLRMTGQGDGRECPSCTSNTNGNSTGLCPVDSRGGLSPHLDRGLKPCSIFLRFGGTTGSRALPGLFLLAQGEQFWAALLFRERYYRATSKRLGSNEGDGLFRGQAWVSAGRWLHLTLTPAFFSACSRSTRACVPRGLKLSFILLLIAALKRCCHPTAPPSRLTSPLRFLVRRFRDQLLLGSLRRCWRGW